MIFDFSGNLKRYGQAVRLGFLWDQNSEFSHFLRVQVTHYAWKFCARDVFEVLSPKFSLVDHSGARILGNGIVSAKIRSNRVDTAERESLQCALISQITTV